MRSDEIIAAAKARLMEMAKSKARATAAALIEATPARTGRTRCSFVASIGAPAVDTDPGKDGADPSGRAALDQIDSVIDSIKPGDTLFVTSDYPNAARLDEGTREEPPHAMVDRAVQGWGS